MKPKTVEETYNLYIKRANLPELGGFEAVVYYSGVLDTAYNMLRGADPHEVIKECLAKSQCMLAINKAQLQAMGVNVK